MIDPRAASGLLGGLVGNQGGIRSGALMAANMPRHVFVATATSIGYRSSTPRVCPANYITLPAPEFLAIWPTREKLR